MTPRILTVTLNPAVDKLVEVPGFKIGKDFRNIKPIFSAGGKGINVSRTLACLGDKSLAMGFLAGFRGTFIRRLLDKEKIKSEFIETRGEARTSLTITDHPSHQFTRIIENGPRASKDELKKFKAKFKKIISNFDWVVISGKNIPGAPDSFYAELIQLAQHKGVRVAFDSSQKALKRGLMAKPFLIKPNVSEASFVLGHKIYSFKQIKSACGFFHDQGIKVVAITAGSSGAVVSNGREVLVLKGPSYKAKMVVGCGDSFLAGFISVYSRSQDLGKAARMGLACGAAGALTDVPGLVARSQVMRILKTVRICKDRPHPTGHKRPVRTKG